MLTSSGPNTVAPRNTTTENPRKGLHNHTSSAPVITQVLAQRTRIPDPHNVPALSRSNLPIGQLSPMPLINVQSQQISRPDRDLEPAPEVDPNMEAPLHEVQIEAMLRAPEMEDFALSPALSEHAKGKPMIAQHLPKQSDIDKLMKQLNRKILT